jgi:hypothetical protein
MTTINAAAIKVTGRPAARAVILAKSPNMCETPSLALAFFSFMEASA